MTRFRDYLDRASAGDDLKPPRATPMPIRAWLTPRVDDQPREFTGTPSKSPDEWMMTVEDGDRNEEIPGKYNDLVALARRRHVSEIHVWFESRRTFRLLDAHEDEVE